MGRISTIPPNFHFLNTLDDGLMEHFSGDVSQYARLTLYLPTQRACRAFEEVLLMRHHQLLLPKLKALGESDLSLENVETGITLPGITPLTPLRRLMLLIRLVREKEPSLSLDQASRLASALAQLLDEIQYAEADVAQLPNLVQNRELAHHWELTVNFLTIITEHWPAILAEEGKVDPVTYHTFCLREQAAVWLAQAPCDPIMIAGSTGSLPSTREFMGAVSKLPNGHVVLPGLDQEMSEEAWQILDETHPQFSMRAVLEHLSMKRKEVESYTESPLRPSERVKLLNCAMLPAPLTEGWRDLRQTEFPATCTSGLHKLELQNPAHEADAIALYVRHIMESPDKTVMVVTPDRDLAERVKAALLRWGLRADDSAGMRASRLPLGSYLRLILNVLNPNTPSVELLSLLKHPYTSVSVSLKECRNRTRQTELYVFRADNPIKDDWLEHISQILKDDRARYAQSVTLSEHIDRHIKLAERLATTDTENGAKRLWNTAQGEVVRTWFEDWIEASRDYPPITLREYGELFSELLEELIYRPPYGNDPRVSILGPLEARLIHADYVILASLNEGIWPPEIIADPWLSRPMKRDLKLALPERRFGLSAHDFLHLASASNVLLTRARLHSNAPTVPSRFLLQLETVLRALNYIDPEGSALTPENPYDLWALKLDQPKDVIALLPPEPRPALSLRPRSLSVSQIGLWLRNPYALYAEKILHLKKINALDRSFSTADRGTLIHKIVENFIASIGLSWPDDALYYLLEEGKKEFSKLQQAQEIRAIFWPYFTEVATHYCSLESERRKAGITPLLTEAEALLELPKFRLKGRVDRIDRDRSGGIEIIDYKTGAVPLEKDVILGYEPQLPLLALMAEEGCFLNQPGLMIKKLIYWKIGRKANDTELIEISNELPTLIKEARDGLTRLIDTFDDPSTPYFVSPNPIKAPLYDDYLHLSRRAEWGLAGGDE